MGTAILHIHTTAIFLFTGYLTLKLILLFASEGTLDKMKKVRFLDPLLGLTIIGTGIYMVTQIGMAALGGWFHLKLTLVVIGIPLGIISFKKKNKALATLSVLIFVYLIALALTKNPLIF